MKLRTFISTLVLVFVALGIENVVAQNFAAPYLQRPTSAEGAAFGRAYTALATDASATYWNPAGLTGVKSYSFTGMMSSNMGYGREFNAASAAYTLQDMGTFGVSFTMSGVSDIQGYDAENNPTGTFSTSNLVGGLSYAYPVTSNLSLGATGKYISQDLEVITDEGYSLDLGARFSKDMISSGVIVQNVVGEVGPDNLPTAMRIGFAVEPLEGLTGAFDLEMDDVTDEDAETYTNFGIGYDLDINNQFTVGLKSGMRNSNYTAGGKITAKVKPLSVSFDYAYVNEPSFFGASHRIGLRVSGL